MTDILADLMALLPSDVPQPGVETPAPEMHDTTLTVDRFARRNAEQLTATYEGFSVPEMADGFSACFEPRPVLRDAEATTEPVRREWFRQLLETPEFRTLHSSTMCSTSMSEIGSVELLREWQRYEEEYEPHEEDEEPIGHTVDRIRSTQRAIKQAADDVRDARDGAAAFGLEVGQDTGTDPKAVMRMFRQLKDNPTLRHISECAGRFRRLAASLQRAKPVHGMDDMVGVVLDDDLGRLLVNEQAALCVPELELDTLRRLTERQAMCREYKARESLGRGPIMVLVDESSSMRGERIAHAKGLALALTWLARHQNRWISLVGWSSEGQVRHVTFPPGEVDQAALMGWCAQQFDGGTYPPLDAVSNLFAETGAPKGKTDVIWITDGECGLPGEAQFNRFREKENLKVWTIAVGTSGDSFQPVSDVVASVNTLGTDTEVVRDLLSM